MILRVIELFSNVTWLIMLVCSNRHGAVEALVATAIDAVVMLKVVVGRGGVLYGG
jgi:hypothetical protein